MLNGHVSKYYGIETLVWVQTLTRFVQLVSRMEWQQHCFSLLTPMCVLFSQVFSLQSIWRVSFEAPFCYSVMSLISRPQSTSLIGFLILTQLKFSIFSKLFITIGTFFIIFWFCLNCLSLSLSFFINRTRNKSITVLVLV